MRMRKNLGRVPSSRLEGSKWKSIKRIRKKTNLERNPSSKLAMCEECFKMEIN